ncbi:gamma-tubulin complex component protein [Rhizophagus irregularis DAOM 181602=DAOM 197198]|nr:gamma-tubulin complex component protein [Rhizophagus irregularis DAOM 181602=DAOM 197198]POG75049.1 gamma-tubulin complex component protein [Rhizophagus irregularis DAOM 181602=DAOM 197198]|eukprot:XP_025181915.1 gamma-tubulin complex component protein [Rhizophagus irregularis DAOM 181602=DAOM 197198]
MLLALSGLSGDLFVPYPPEPEIATTFKIPPDFPFLHEAEKSSLERLSALGFYYRKIANFLDKQRGRNENNNNSESIEAQKGSNNTLRGSFLHALCNAINEVLADFHKSIIESEIRILSKEDNMGGVVPISQLVSAFNEYYIILPHLNQLINDIEQNSVKYFGCRIINLVIDKCNTGVPELREIMLKLLHACHEVMYKHIASWLVYGQLVDPFGEFFIKDKTLKLNPIQIQEQFSRSKWHRRFILDESFIPNHIPNDVAKSILFVGKAIATVRNSAKPYDKHSKFPDQIASLHLQYLLELSSRPVFNQIELENIVNIIRDNVAQWLWQVVLTGDKVVECLETFKNYFLLGQGDFTTSLVEQFEKLPTSRLSSTRAPLIKEQEMNSLLVRASVGTLAEKDLAFEKFRFKISEKATSMFDDILVGVPLRFEYDIGWPLDLFVTSEDLSKYGDIFSFLISLRRTHYKLQKVWTHLATNVKMERNYKFSKGGNNIMLMPWNVRASMMFFVDCLWAHVQMDIIESNFQNLVRRITVSSAHHQKQRPSSTTEPSSPISPTRPKSMNPKKDTHSNESERLRDFEDIRLGHTSYLDELLRGCLLESRVCTETIRMALKIIDKFCVLLERWDGQRDFMERLEQIAKHNTEFREQVMFLFRTLSGVNKTGGDFGGPPRHLDQLLLRLDYSKWFSVWSS